MLDGLSLPRRRMPVRGENDLSLLTFPLGNDAPAEADGGLGVEKLNFGLLYSASWPYEAFWSSATSLPK